MQPDNEAIINKIREQIQAEQETKEELKRQNDLMQASLEAEDRRKKADDIRNRMWLDISEGTATLVQRFPELLLTIHGFAEKLEGFGRRIEESTTRLDRLEYGVMLLLSGKGNGNKERVTDFIRDIQKDRLKALLSENYELLHDLEMKKVAYSKEHSTLDIPLWMSRELDDAKTEISKLENDLRQLG